MHPFKYLLVLLGSLLLTGLLAAILLWRGDLWFNMPPFERYPVQGLDISGHQGEINWPEVAQGPWSFVYIKATEGGDFVDPTFARNWEQSRQTGLLRGAYHFYTFCRPGAEQAQNFVKTVPIEPNTLPPVVDLEFGGNCSKRPYSAELIPEVQIFLNAIEKHTGQHPILYVTDTFAKTHLNQGQLANYSLWVRDIVREPALFNGRAWQFWQFSNRGKVPGIQGRVDLNVFKGSPAELRRLFLPLSPRQN